MNKKEFHTFCDDFDFPSHTDSCESFIRKEIEILEIYLSSRRKVGDSRSSNDILVELVDRCSDECYNVVKRRWILDYCGIKRDGDYYVIPKSYLDES